MESAGVNFNIDPNQQIPVLDSTANKILDSIYKYLSNISDNIDETGRNTSSHLDEISRGQRHEENSATARSKASQSNDRAVQKALAGISNNQRNSLANENRNRAVDKALTGSSAKAMNNNFKNLLNGILGGLKNLGGLLMPHLVSHFKSQADLAKRLRQNFNTREEKDKAQRMANSMQGTVEAKFGFKLDRSEINDYLLSLQSMGKDLDTMGEERVAAFAALKKSGLSDEAALKAAMSASADTVNKLTDAATDPRARQLIMKQIETASDAELAMNGVDNVFGQIIVSSQNMSKNAGNAITDFDKMSESLANNRRAANGMTEEVDGAMLAIQGGIKTIGSEGNALVENANKYSIQQLRALASSGDEATQKMANQMLQIKNMQASGAEIGTNTRSSAQNKSAKRDNASNGKINFEIQKFLGKLDNNVFGGNFGKMANRIDEMFGDSADITTIASTGFRIVSKLLTSINMKTGFMGKALLGLGGAAAVVALVANWDKIKPKLGEIFDNIRPMIAKVVQNIPSFIKDIVSGIGSLLPEVWKGLKNALSGFFSGDGLLGKAGSSISGSLSGLSKSLAGSGKSAAGSVRSATSKVDLSGVGKSIKDSAPTFKGFFDGLGSAIADAVPGIRDIVLKVVDVIDKFIDIVAPAVPAIVQVLQTVAEAIIPTVDAIREIGVSVVDCIRELGVSLIDGVKEIVVTTVDAVKEVLLALAEPIRLIAEAVNVLVKAIAPVIPKIVSTIEYAVKQILPQVLNLIGEVVRTILPPILEIAKKVVDTLLPPIVDAFTKLVDTIMPPIAEVLQTVAALIDRIVNLVIDILEPPLTAISEVITSVADFVNDIVGVAHGMFNFFADKLPPIIGWMSGIFSWLSEYIFPIVKSGFNVLYNIVNALWKGLKLVIEAALTPIKKIINAIDLGIKAVKFAIYDAMDTGDEEHETAVARREMEEAALVLQGHDAGEKTLALKKAYEDYLAQHVDEEGNSTIGDSASDTGKEAERLWKRYTDALAKEKSSLEKAYDEAADAGSGLVNAVDDFVGNIGKAVNSGGPTFDAAAANSAADYLSGKNGGITMKGNVTLPANTGSLLEAIANNVKKHTDLLTKIHDFITKIKTYAKGTPGTHGAGLVGEAGREAIVPLDNKSAMQAVVDKMTPADKQNIASAAAGEYAEALNRLNAWKGGKLKPKDFALMIGPIAREAMKTTGMPASVLVAQAALETGWGKTAKAEFRNLFGIKGKGDAGSAKVWTHERRKDGSKEVKEDYFAQYSSFVASIEAYNRYLMNAKRPKHKLPGDLRYAEAMQHVFEPNLFAYLIRDGGYATSANYGAKLVSVMKGHNLYQYDLQPGAIHLKNIGSIQSELIRKAVENLKSPESSAKRMEKLRQDEYERLVKKAAAEGKNPPKPPSGLNLGPAMIANAVNATLGSAAADTVAAANEQAQQPIAKELTPEEYSQLYSNLAEGTDVVAEGVKAKTDTQLETLQNLSKNAINTVIAQTNGQVRYDVSNSKSAKKVSDSNSQRDEIVLAMKDVVKYLRDMAAFVKKPTGASVPARLPHA